MANPFSKGWKYMMSSFDKKIEDNADPKVQIHQAAEAAREQHRQIQQQAAAVIGNRNQLEMQLARLNKERDKLTKNARTAVEQADAARAGGDEGKAAELENTAQVFASQLVSVENEIDQTTEMHGQAVRAAAEAQEQAKLSQVRYEELKTQIRELESQADQAKMQEHASRTLEGIQSATNNPNVPTLDDVREKIEGRYARALGAQELAESSPAGRMAEIEAAGTDAAASSRLAEIRAQMASEGSGKALEDGGKSGSAGELEAGAEGADADGADTVSDEDVTVDPPKNGDR